MKVKSVVFLGATAGALYLIYRQFFAEDQVSRVASTAPARDVSLPADQALPTSLQPGGESPFVQSAGPLQQAEDVNQAIELNAIVPEVEAQTPKLPKLVSTGLKVQTNEGTKTIKWDCPKINQMKRTYHRLSKKDKKPETIQRARLAAQFLHKVEEVKCNA